MLVTVGIHFYQEQNRLGLENSIDTQKFIILMIDTIYMLDALN